MEWASPHLQRQRHPVTQRPALKRPAHADADFLGHVEKALRSAPVPLPPPVTGPAPARGNETVLLVDDEPGVRMLARTMLETLGYRVLEAATTEEAVRTVGSSTDPIHLLLTDVRMPLGGGKALTAVLTARHPDLRVLWMSGYSDDPAVRRRVRRRAVDFLPKPFTLNDLAGKVRQALDAG
jgi:two-component system cell cycle sensor histidine kinase/response regulator CckA